MSYSWLLLQQATMTGKGTRKRTISFPAYYVGFLAEGAAMPQPNQVTVELSEPIAIWFGEMLVNSQREKFYRQWEATGKKSEFCNFLEKCLATQMEEKRWERTRAGGGAAFRRVCVHPLCAEILEAVGKEGWYFACRLHLSIRHGFPLWWADMFLSYDKAVQATGP